LLQGTLIAYAGDPLLDFGLANFLDRIAYKNPKSLDKLATSDTNKHQQLFASNRRMAASEQPVNTYNFAGTGADGDMPANPREEEEYMYRYFKLRGPKETTEVDKKRKKDEAMEGSDDEEMSLGSDEDPEEEAFARDIMEK
jgi:hypothetical protein